MLNMPDHNSIGLFDDAAFSHIESYSFQGLINSSYVNKAVKDPTRRYYLFFQHGYGQISIDGNFFELGPGSIVIVPAYSLFMLSLANTAVGLMFSGSEFFLRTKIAPVLNAFPRRYLDNYYKPSIYERLNGVADSQGLNDCFKEAEAARSKLGQGNDGAVMAYIFLLLGENISKNQFGNKTCSNKYARDSAVLYRFHRLIERYYARHFSIDKYSSLLSISRHRLTDVCKQIADMTPLELVYKRLILEARRELSSTGKSISEIACELGYADAAYFSRFFKKQTNNTPQDYRTAYPIFNKSIHQQRRYEKNPNIHLLYPWLEH